MCAKADGEAEHTTHTVPVEVALAQGVACVFACLHNTNLSWSLKPRCYSYITPLTIISVSLYSLLQVTIKINGPHQPADLPEDALATLKSRVAER